MNSLAGKLAVDHDSYNADGFRCVHRCGLDSLAADWGQPELSYFIRLCEASDHAKLRDESLRGSGPWLNFLNINLPMEIDRLA